MVKKEINDKESENPYKKRVRRSYIYSVGKRKTAVARVRLFKGGIGNIVVNEQDFHKYFPYFEFHEIVTSPLKAVAKMDKLNFNIKVHGGGFRGQAEAIRHGISNALIKMDKTLRPTLKPLGYLRRDPRKKERKKPGLKAARRAPQWQKR